MPVYNFNLLDGLSDEQLIFSEDYHDDYNEGYDVDYDEYDEGLESIEEQSIYKYVKHGTGFILIETKFFYKRNSSDFHVYIIMEKEGHNHLLPVPIDFVFDIDKSVKRDEARLSRRRGLRKRRPQYEIMMLSRQCQRSTN